MLRDRRVKLRSPSPFWLSKSIQWRHSAVLRSCVGQKGTGLPSWGAPREQLGRKKPSGAEQKQIDLSRRFYPLELEVLTLVAELSRAHCLGVLCSQVCNVSSWAFNVTGMKCSLKLIWLTLAASDINCRFEDEKKPVTVSTLQELSSWETIQRGEGHSWER